MTIQTSNIATKLNMTSTTSLTQKAYEELEEMIVTMLLEPGSVLSEPALTEQLGIGRTPIREALQRLSLEGLVSIIPRKGITVSEINPAKQLKVLEIRRVVERLLAQKAAIRRSPEHSKLFLEIANEIEKSSEICDEMAFMQYDNLLHRTIAKVANNEFAARAEGMFHGLSRRFWFAHHRRVGDINHIAKLHINLALAIADGNESVAADASDEIIDHSEDFIRATLDTF